MGTAYFITGHTNLELSNPDEILSRTYGYYRSLEKAIDTVTHNYLDIREDVYNYVTIDEVCEGIYQGSNKTMFFKWNKELNKYVEVEEPSGGLKLNNMSYLNVG